MSININGASPWSWAWRCYKPMSPPLSGADPHGHHAMTTTHWREAGVLTPQNLLWNKILLQPSGMGAGFVLSDVDFAIEVWSTFRDSAKTLTSISTTGPGNLALTDPYGVVAYQPGQSRLYPASLPGLGDLSIDSRTEFTFSDAPGARFVATGTRITVFSHRPDWSEPWKETASYLTEILPAYNGTEQRRALRTRSRLACTYRVLTTSPIESMALETLVYGWQARQYGVPWWPETTLLIAPVAAGGRVLPCTTRDRPSFTEGGMVLIWADYDQWEAFQVVAVGSDAVEIGAALTRNWPAGSRVVPLRRGRLGAEQGLDRPTNWLTAGSFTFTCESV